MKELIVPALKLALICSLAGLSLGAINGFTQPIIEKNRAQKLQEALLNVLPPDKNGELGSGQAIAGHKVVKEVYPVSASGDTIGYITILLGNGYGGEMRLVAYYQSNGELVNAILLEHNETPGLGSMATEASYMAMFAGGGGDKPIPTGKKSLNPEQADAITGVTVTFSGVSAALTAGSRYIGQL